MKLRRRRLLLILASALTAGGLLWAFALRGDGPQETDTSGFTESERAELLNRGIVLLPGAKVMSWSEEDANSPVSDIVAYRLEGTFGEAEVEGALSSIERSLEEMGWNLGKGDYRNPSGDRVRIQVPRLLLGRPFDFQGNRVQFAGNRQGTHGVFYELESGGESGLVIRTTSLRLRPGTPTPTPTPRRRPIS